MQLEQEETLIKPFIKKTNKQKTPQIFLTNFSETILTPADRVGYVVTITKAWSDLKFCLVVFRVYLQTIRRAEREILSSMTMGRRQIWLFF